MDASNILIPALVVGGSLLLASGVFSETSGGSVGGGGANARLQPGGGGEVDRRRREREERERELRRKEREERERLRKKYERVRRRVRERASEVLDESQEVVEQRKVVDELADNTEVSWEEKQAEMLRLQELELQALQEEESRVRAEESVKERADEVLSSSSEVEQQRKLVDEMGADPSVSWEEKQMAMMRLQELELQALRDEESRSRPDQPVDYDFLDDGHVNRMEVCCKMQQKGTYSRVPEWECVDEARVDDGLCG